MAPQLAHRTIDAREQLRVRQTAPHADRIALSRVDYQPSQQPRYVECVFQSIMHGLADDDAAPRARPHDHVYRLAIPYETTTRREALRV